MRGSTRVVLDADNVLRAWFVALPVNDTYTLFMTSGNAPLNTPLAQGNSPSSATFSNYPQNASGSRYVLLTTGLSLGFTSFPQPSSDNGHLNTVPYITSKPALSISLSSIPQKLQKISSSNGIEYFQIVWLHT